MDIKRYMGGQITRKAFRLCTFEIECVLRGTEKIFDIIIGIASLVKRMSVFLVSEEFYAVTLRRGANLMHFGKRFDEEDDVAVERV